MKLSSTDDEMPESDDAPEGTADMEKALRTQRPMEVSSANYVDLGAAQMVIGADGMPTVAGEPRPAANGLSSWNFICTADPAIGRPACKYSGSLLVSAEGMIRGFGKEQPRAIRRFCTKLAAQSELMELTEVEVFACTLRSPADPASAEVIAQFELRQKKVASEASMTTDDFTL